MHEELSREDQPGHRHYEHQLWQIRRCGIQKVKTGSERNICVVIKEKKKKKKKEPGALFVVIACFFCAGCALFFFFCFFFCVCVAAFHLKVLLFFCVCVSALAGVSEGLFFLCCIYAFALFSLTYTQTDIPYGAVCGASFFFFLCSVEVTLT